jgi:hypothetical protein
VLIRNFRCLCCIFLTSAPAEDTPQSKFRIFFGFPLQTVVDRLVRRHKFHLPLSCRKPLLSVFLDKLLWRTLIADCFENQPVLLI